MEIFQAGSTEVDFELRIHVQRSYLGNWKRVKEAGQWRGGNRQFEALSWPQPDSAGSSVV